MELQEIRDLAERAARELLALEGRGFRRAETLVVGCSSSEIVGGRIGHMSSPETGKAVAEGVLAACRAAGCEAAFQCCEHLNRALVVERATARRLGLEEVWVVPRPKAGGSLASAAWKLMEDPVCVEFIRADAGLDIGETLIGMHLRAVAVPVRLSVREIGSARVAAARTRPKLVGGERARYTEED